VEVVTLQAKLISRCYKHSKRLAFCHVFC